MRAILGPARAPRPATATDVSKYATSKAAVNVAGKLQKQDNKRIDKATDARRRGFVFFCFFFLPRRRPARPQAFWGRRAVRAGGTVPVPLYRPGSPFPVLTHVSTLGADETAAGRGRRTLRKVLGGAGNILAHAGQRPQTSHVTSHS